jgi:hypothetical protein
MNAALAALFEEDLRIAREIEQRPWVARPLSSRFAEHRLKRKALVVSRRAAPRRGSVT